MEKRAIRIMIARIVVACVVVAGVGAYFISRELGVEVLIVQEEVNG